ncbi:lipase [Pilaira anomala]|nr:lipase [Pilaira anomala]
MVSFISIAKGVTLIMMIGVTSAAPTASSVPHIDDSNVVPFTRPAFISTRIVPVKNPAVLGDLSAESKSAKKNKAWLDAHASNSTLARTSGSPEYYSGLTMVAPANAPPISTYAATVEATAAQITEYRHHAALSASSYCESVVTSGQWTCTDCKAYVPDGKLIVTFNSAANQLGGYLLRSDTKKTIYLVFRGSSNTQNWITNAQFIRGDYTPVSGASVHSGFYKAFNAVTSYYYSQFLDQHKAYPGYKVIVTGHSLGGAQALLAALDLYQRVSTLHTGNLIVYSQGAPRTGNDQFAYYVDYTGIKNYRSVYNRDIVPHLAPQNLGYLHPGVEVWAKSGTTATICPSNIETNDCSNSIVPFTNINDHKTYFNVGQGCN